MSKGTYPIKIYASGTTTASAAASAFVPKNGRIVAIDAALNTMGGAGVDGRILYELSYSSVSTVSSGDITNAGFFYLGCHNNVASSASSANKSLQGISEPVESGQRIYLHINAGGTALSAAVFCAVLYVLES